MTADAPADPQPLPTPLAAIDVGSNTTRLLVARALGERVLPLATGSAMTALGAGLSPGGRIGEERLELVGETVRRMAAEARALGAERIVVACTAPARAAANADELVARLEAASGAPVRVLTGEEEAVLAFRGLVAAGAPDPLLAIDLGGGSMELMVGEGGRLRWATSIPIGVRSLSERFAAPDPPPIDLVEPMIAAVREMLDRISHGPGIREGVAAGGSATALATLAGTERLDRDALVRAVERLAASPAADLAEETGLEPARIRLCVAGAAALEAARRSFGLLAVGAARGGLREGMLLDAASR